MGREVSGQMSEWDDRDDGRGFEKIGESGGKEIKETKYGEFDRL
jgi:hypothetical protein